MHKKEQITVESTNYQFLPRTWYFIAVTHSHNILRKSEAQLFVNGQSVQTFQLSYPKTDKVSTKRSYLSDHINGLTLCNSLTYDATLVFHPSPKEATTWFVLKSPALRSSRTCWQNKISLDCSSTVPICSPYTVRWKKWFSPSLAFHCSNQSPRWFTCLRQKPLRLIGALNQSHVTSPSERSSWQVSKNITWLCSNNLCSLLVVFKYVLIVVT